MKKIARGVMTFEYDLKDLPEAGMSEEEAIEYFLDNMVEDVVSIMFSDIRSAIEMTIVEIEE
jgi:hypothetical protein